AFAAAVVTYGTHSPWLGLAGGMGAGLAAGACYAFFVIPLRANQVVAGMALNLLALGLTPFLCKILYDVTGSTPSISMGDRFRVAPLYLCWVAVALCWFVLKWTPAGLWVGFAGEHPGALAGAGGASLSIFLASSFSRDMTAGRGFMALAALIFGKWKPLPAALACLLFGFAEALQIRLQGVWGQGQIPVEFIQILPYVATILVLAGFVGRARAPKSLGVPWRPS